MNSLADIELDFRFKLGRLNLGLRLYLFRWQLRLYKAHLQLNPSIGPIELNLFWWKYSKLNPFIDFSASISFSWCRHVFSLRAHPCVYRFKNKKGSFWCGPFWMCWW